MNNTLSRILVALIGIPLLIFLMIEGNYVFLVFCVTASFFCMNEFYNLFEKPAGIKKFLGGFTFKKFMFLLVSTLIVICFYYMRFNYVIILYFLMFLFLIVDELYKAEKHFEAIGTWLLAIIYISSPFGLLSLMGSDKFINIFGANFALICMVMIWVSDTFAFWGGKTFGNHKLAEKISPKKTWEGAISGFLFTVITGAVIYFLYPAKVELWNMLVIAVIAGVTAILGDLFESYLKRSVDIKDSSQMIPGHGGVLDRFDSILFAVPALYIYLYLKSTF